MRLEDLILFVVLPAMALAMVLTFVRLVRGPSLPDRVIALDLMGTLGMGMIAAYAIAHNLPVLLDVAIVLALLSFLGTIAFARYLEQRGGP
ncbi:MAG: cation:proton antiporter [Anaerolineae bacterium]|nr:cation:proton antiporter [Anaerolineae bacterium]MCX8068409.1 cation:proton antiporter [Anaerolineae bacterium]MDW7991555.1 cation:proton antiporter [Anaerolineae bacterium]